MGINFDSDYNLDKLDSFLESAKNNQNGIVMFDTEYALYVEYPTEYTDKKPPFDELYEWVVRNINTSDPEATTYRIQEYIYQNGTEGVFFLNRTKEDFKNQRIDTIIDSYSGDIENAPENIMKEILDEMLANAEEIIQQEAYDTGELLESGIVELSANSDLVE